MLYTRLSNQEYIFLHTRLLFMAKYNVDLMIKMALRLSAFLPLRRATLDPPWPRPLPSSPHKRRTIRGEIIGSAMRSGFGKLSALWASNLGKNFFVKRNNLWCNHDIGNTLTSRHRLHFLV